jgi:hypothetical protein
VKASENLPKSRKDEQFQELVADLLARGLQPAEVAARLAGEDKKARHNMRKRVWRMVRQDPEFQRRLAERAVGEEFLKLVPTSKAVGRRAARGNITAARLLYESTGFYNPKAVEHKHSGSVEIKIAGIPRPVAGLEDSPPIDAEVVEED